MALDKKHVDDTCKPGTSECCAFLTMAGDWECAKDTEFEAHILGHLAEGTMRATGDNCSGPPDFKTEIGYDENGLMIHMAHKQKVGDMLMSCTTDTERQKVEAELVEHSKEVILKKTGIEVGSKAVVCLTKGFSLLDGMKPLHDHDDPDQHITVEVTDIDCWGNIHYLDEEDRGQETHMGMITRCEE